jgi:hypothetical protein
MGRGQSKIRDLFSGVFGESRGLRQDQTPSAPSNTTILSGEECVFARDQIDLYRRMGVLQWLEEHTSALGMDVFSAALIDDLASVEFYPSHDPKARMDRCREDIKELVSQGLIAANNAGSSDEQYSLLPIDEWPDANRAVYFAWDEGLSLPLGHLPADAARRFMLLYTWARPDSTRPLPEEEKYIAEIYKSAYPGIKDEQIHLDLEDLVKQEICTKHMVAGKPIRYSLNSQEDWPEKQSEIYDWFMAKVFESVS